MLEYDTENMNSEEIFSSLRGVTEAIQSFSFRSQEEILEPIKRDGKREDPVSAGPSSVRRSTVDAIINRLKLHNLVSHSDRCGVVWCGSSSVHRCDGGRPDGAGQQDVLVKHSVPSIVQRPLDTRVQPLQLQRHQRL